MPKMFEKIKISLSDPERLVLGDQLAEKECAYNELAAEKKEALDGFNAKLKSLEAEITDIATQVKDGVVEKDLEIREEFDDARKMVRIIRVDDGAVLRTRSMTLNETVLAEQRLQGNLFDGSKSATSDTEPPPPADDDPRDTDENGDPIGDLEPVETTELEGQTLVNARKAKRAKKNGAAVEAAE